MWLLAEHLIKHINESISNKNNHVNMHMHDEAASKKKANEALQSVKTLTSTAIINLGLGKITNSKKYVPKELTNCPKLNQEGIQKEVQKYAFTLPMFPLINERIQEYNKNMSIMVYNIDKLSNKKLRFSEGLLPILLEDRPAILAFLETYNGREIKMPGYITG